MDVPDEQLRRDVVDVVSMTDPPKDRQYWMSRTPAERFEALERSVKSLMATIRLPRDFSEFLKLLNSNGVEYLLVGGYAVNYYGYSRSTGDRDVWIS